VKGVTIEVEYSPPLTEWLCPSCGNGLPRYAHAITTMVYTGSALFCKPCNALWIDPDDPVPGMPVLVVRLP